ncbi:MAG: hypothetical protein WC503_05205 [Candidatus Shapirobacteria bacterium]
MLFELSPDRQLVCEISDIFFKNNVKYLLDLSTKFLDKIPNIDSIDSDLLDNLADECWDISKIRTDLSAYSDLSDEDNYFNVFIGQYSQNFIQIMMDIQLLWQVRENLDTYTGFSMSREYTGGVSPSDKKHFYTTLKDMYNKLKILNHLIQKQS